MSQVEETTSTTLTGSDLGENDQPPANPAESTGAESNGTGEQTSEASEAAPTSDDPAEATEAETEDKVRRGRGLLEVDVKSVTDAFVQGQVTLGEGDLLTPHRIGRQIKERDSLDKAPSTGAIVNVLKKWSDIGFAVVNDKPLAFTDYTDAARSQGLSALKEQHAAANPRPKRASKNAEASIENNTPAPSAPENSGDQAGA